MFDIRGLRPVQCLAASIFFNKKRLLLALPRQYGGKTELGVRLLHDITRRPFTSSSLFLAKDKKSGKKATREKFERIFSKDHFHVNTENVYLKKHTTSVIFMDSVDKDPDRIRGGTYSCIHWSEVAFSKIEKGESIISVFDKVIQPTLTQTDGYVLLESTNNGKNGWYDLWNDYQRYGFSRLKLGLSDLVYMGIISPEEYEKVKSTTHPDVFKQEYECEWVSFQGKVYNEFDEKRHVANIDGPKEWQKVAIAIDWGYDPSATCILFAYVHNGKIHVFDEHYEKRELAAITAEKLEAKLQKWGVKRFGAVADHEEDRIEELNRRSIPCGKAKKTNVLGARIEIKELLYFDRIVFHPRCEMTLRDLNAAVWHEKKEGELDEGACTWGHFDGEATLRYLVRELGQLEAIEPIENPHAEGPSSAAWDIMNRRDQEPHEVI
jgi:hypothetical protein